ncbi:protein FAM124B isoform X2 [Polypterus senegalus]|uniref:protein FAM124B isoform X2 n=1 Tax=Polypterus senegalus TaxID=55291 RepID=UPI0019632B03|nr:protein FAM124B isoform X2 [Polypterus senegalus]
MSQKATRLTEDEGSDSGAETAESDCSKMSSSSSDFIIMEQQDVLLMTVHLLANPGESFLLQQTLNHLLKCVSPDIHLFKVSERAVPVKHSKYDACKRSSSYPSLSIILFLHEDFGEERILQVHEFFQHLPWQYHHSESAGGKMVPFLISSQDFYSLDADMPVWAVRQVHYGSEIIRVTLYCSHDNYDDTVRMYETILQREASSQKLGFCYFTLYSNSSLSIQLSLKQLSPGVSVELKESAVLQFRVQEIGQLVPLLPHPCSPISSTRWQTEDYDGNKIIFQVKGNARSYHKSSMAFEVSSTSVVSVSTQGSQMSDHAAFPYNLNCHSKNKAHQSSGLNSSHMKPCVNLQTSDTTRQSEYVRSDSCSSTPQSSSCYSSQRSSPATLSRLELTFEGGSSIATTGYNVADSRHCLSTLQESEMNVDTGIMVADTAISGQTKCPFNGFSKDVLDSLPDAQYSAAASLMACSVPSSRKYPNGIAASVGFQQQMNIFPQSQTQKNEKEDEFFI